MSDLEKTETLLQPRSQLPKSLNRFPFNRFKFLKRGILKFLDFLFRDQQKINLLLFESLKINHKWAEETAEHARELKRETVEHVRELRQEIVYLQTRHSNQTLLFNSLINKNDASSYQQLSEVIQEEDAHWLDPFYVAFQNAFRGTREEIKNRLSVYLPVIKTVHNQIQSSRIVDIGCGRGEWLELLKELGYSAQGIDLNKMMIQQCQERGLDVIESDALAYLHNLPDACLSAVTAFHFIEHLSFTELVRLIDESLRVLKKGGVAIFETPNPQNILVGSCNFYLDPTHRNPLPSPLTQFIVEKRGFLEVKILNLHPIERNTDQESRNLPEHILERFSFPQDYSVIGYKR
ncbi:MAG: hypothetical protein A3E26_04510 [Chlamydiae bacterium RIFCSPHIGHO2_12_FULL_49_32]|nr:MAG: hypothetical protein A3E26_04510 [Chlamydiae bacterium RIFCSPHIGHO2_12_FULL_49_32]